MKKIIDFYKCNTRQIFEIFALILAIVIPWVVNLQELFKVYLAINPIAPDNMWWYLALTLGKPIASIILFVALLLVFRKANSDFIMNRRYIYHDYCYVWYWICAKVLGIKKCNLVLVPIYMQFNLVIRGTFPEYPLQDEDYPVIDTEADCIVSITHKDRDKGTINLILEDTYAIDSTQIPEIKRRLRTIKISRNDGNKERHFSQKFIEAVINTVRDLDQNTIVNIYATTNPMNTKHIASRAFALADRGNIQHLYVFQQKESDGRMFVTKGHKIF